MKRTAYLMRHNNPDAIALVANLVTTRGDRAQTAPRLVILRERAQELATRLYESGELIHLVEVAPNETYVVQKRTGEEVAIARGNCETGTILEQPIRLSELRRSGDKEDKLEIDLVALATRMLDKMGVMLTGFMQPPNHNAPSERTEV
ncbi:hypothetical protein HZC07_03365 [Candidatus Micrarchaeota archaeon]|nr:hypothetical protein [Candidatus Micrarchaeota archaeon]